MYKTKLKKSLARLPLGDIQYFESLGSTNDEALAWAANDARDLSLVIADEQTAGRGRRNRTWFTLKGTALAFSLILRPTPGEQKHLTRIVGLAALAVAEALRARGLAAHIKWPNDILIHGQKVSGILVESVWSGDDVDCVVIGMGVNVLKASVPPGEVLQFPATSLEDELGQTLTRTEILHDILAALLEIRPRMGTPEFITQWESLLAFHGEPVQVDTGAAQPITGRIQGLEPEGSLRLINAQGESVTVRFGDVHLRPLA